MWIGLLWAVFLTRWMRGLRRSLRNRLQLTSMAIAGVKLGIKADLITATIILSTETVLSWSEIVRNTVVSLWAVTLVSEGSNIVIGAAKITRRACNSTTSITSLNRTSFSNSGGSRRINCESDKSNQDE